MKRKIIYCPTKDVFNNLLDDDDLYDINNMWHLEEHEEFTVHDILDKAYGAIKTTEHDIVVTHHWLFCAGYFGVDNMFVYVEGELIELKKFTKRLLRDVHNIPKLLLAGEFGDMLRKPE